MLNWWLGRPAEADRAQGTKLQAGCNGIPIYLRSLDEDTEIEPPETPAPVFAARALKSALFGTPTPLDDDMTSDDKESGSRVGRDATKPLSRSLSPTKPPGILLTPGTGTARRKTVSFGNEVFDLKDERAEKGDHAEVPDDSPGKFANQWASKPASTKRPRKTALIKSLESAREVKTAKPGPDGVDPSPESKPVRRPSLDLVTKATIAAKASSRRAHESGKNNQDLLQELFGSTPVDCDLTTDLNDPHSQSGKYWKTEYNKYHQEAEAEMQKLLKYKQLAKSYAKKKDADALELSEKLKEEQGRVAVMEDRILNLSARIAAAGVEVSDEESHSLMKELARQTALAVQYKTQVAEFRAVLEGCDRKCPTSSQTEQIILNENVELKNAREQLKEMGSLREELQKAKQDLSDEQAKRARLQEENTKLTCELLHTDFRLEKQLEKYEKKRQSFDQQRQKRENVLQNLQKDYDELKENAKSQRRDAEHLLKKRHDQAVDLKKELMSIRGAEETIQVLQRALDHKTAELQAVSDAYQKEIDELTMGRKPSSKSAVSANDAFDKRLLGSSSKALSSDTTSQTRESLIPISSQSISRPSKALASMKPARSDIPADSLRPRLSHSALSEIINNATVDTTPPRGSGPIQHTPLVRMTPLTNRFSSMSLQSPDLQLPSPEQSLPQITGRSVHERHCLPSPRPSMFNLASSPPKVAMIRSRNSEAKERVGENLLGRRFTNVHSSRLSSIEGSKARRDLPPDRVAAAKARLEQKNAEKKKAQALESDKENHRS